MLLFILFFPVVTGTRSGSSFSFERMGRVHITAPKLFTGNGRVCLRLSSLGRRRCTFPLPNNGIVSTCNAHKKRSKTSVGAYTGSAVHTTFSKIMQVSGPCCTCKGLMMVHRTGKLRAVCDRGYGGLIQDNSIMGTKRPVNLANHANHTAARRIRFRAHVGKRRFGPGLVFSLGREGLQGRYVGYDGGKDKVVIGSRTNGGHVTRGGGWGGNDQPVSVGWIRCSRRNSRMFRPKFGIPSDSNCVGLCYSLTSVRRFNGLFVA